MGNEEIAVTREDAALILHDFKTALEDLNEQLEKIEKLREPPDAFGSGVDGQKSLARATQNGENIYQYVKDSRDALQADEKTVRAGFEALFWVDFDSKVDIAKLDPNIGH